MFGLLGLLKHFPGPGQCLTLISGNWLLDLSKYCFCNINPWLETMLYIVYDCISTKKEYNFALLLVKASKFSLDCQVKERSFRASQVNFIHQLKTFGFGYLNGYVWGTSPKTTYCFIENLWNCLPFGLISCLFFGSFLSMGILKRLIRKGET